MADPAFLIAALIQDCGGKQFNYDKAPWSQGCAEDLLKQLEEARPDWPEGKENQARSIKRILNGLREYFLNKGQTEMTPAKARSKSLELKRLWAEVMPFAEPVE